MTRPKTLADIPTPALLIDLAVMERNLRRMADFFRDSPCKLRPHFKAHKTPEIACRQLAAGSCTGLTCATINEAELVAEFCDDVLIANEVIGAEKNARVAAIAKRKSITVAVDSALGVSQLAEAAAHAGVTVGALVDVNVGMPRCGVQPGDEAVALAKRVHETPGLELRGVMGYEGHAVGLEDRGEREGRARKAMERLLTSVGMIRDGGLPCHIVSAGGTGTFDITGRIEGITEIQPGSYVLMDTAYGKLDVPFEKAAALLATVISRPAAALCVADVGLKSCSIDHGNPSLRDVQGANVLFLSDEHTSIMLPAESPLQPGDRIQIWPSHIDPTINLHDAFYVLDGDAVVGVWPISARGYSEQRAALERA